MSSLPGGRGTGRTLDMSVGGRDTVRGTRTLPRPPGTPGGTPRTIIIVISHENINKKYGHGQPDKFGKGFRGENRASLLPI